MPLHKDVEYCPDCDEPMEKASLVGGGYVAWFCIHCDILVPGGDYIDVRGVGDGS